MNKKQIEKSAAVMAQGLIETSPCADLIDLEIDTYNAEPSDDRNIRLAAVRILKDRSAKAKAFCDKLNADLEALGLGWLYDGNVAAENMDPAVVAAGDRAVEFWVEFQRHICNVVAVGAESEGIHINDKIGYTIY